MLSRNLSKQQLQLIIMGDRPNKNEEEFFDSFEEAQFDPLVAQDVIKAISCQFSKDPDANAKRAILNKLLRPVSEEAEDLVRLVPVLKEVIVDLRVRVEARTYEAVKRAERGSEYKAKLEKATSEIELLKEKVSEANKQAERASEYIDKLEKANGKVESLQDKCSEFENELQKATAEIESLRAEANKKAVKPSNSKDQLAEANDKVESFQEKCSEYEDRLQKATGEIKTLQEKLSGCQSLEKAVEKLRYDNCKLIGDNTGLLAAAGAMEAELKKALAGLPVGIRKSSKGK